MTIRTARTPAPIHGRGGLYWCTVLMVACTTRCPTPSDRAVVTQPDERHASASSGRADRLQSAQADVAQSVERWLPKPKVAGSRPVVRFSVTGPKPGWLCRIRGFGAPRCQSVRVRQRPPIEGMGGARVAHTHRSVSHAMIRRPVTSQGHRYAQFQRALKTGNAHLAAGPCRPGTSTSPIRLRSPSRALYQPRRPLVSCSRAASCGVFLRSIRSACGVAAIANAITDLALSCTSSPPRSVRPRLSHNNPSASTWRRTSRLEVAERARRRAVAQPLHRRGPRVAAC